MHTWGIQVMRVMWELGVMVTFLLLLMMVNNMSNRSAPCQQPIQLPILAVKSIYIIITIIIPLLVMGVDMNEMTNYQFGTSQLTCTQFQGEGAALFFCAHGLLLKGA